MKQTIKLRESELKQIIAETVKQTIKLNEVSASLADKAAGKALTIGREGFGKYGSYYDGIPHDSYHGKKYMQGNRFLQYRNKKLGIDKGYSIYYPDGTGNVIALKDPNGNICTKPCHSIEELEMEYNKSQNESIRRNMDDMMAYPIPGDLSDAIDTLAETFIKAVSPNCSREYARDIQREFYDWVYERYRGATGY